jgi:hypothetical protein
VVPGKNIQFNLEVVKTKFAELTVPVGSVRGDGIAVVAETESVPLFCQLVTVVPDLVIVVVSAASNQRIQFEILLGVQKEETI